MPKVLIVGATSDIARELGHAYGKAGYDLVLAARQSERLKNDQSDFQIRYEVQTELLELDLLDFDSHATQLAPVLDSCEGLILVAGYLGDHEKAKTDWDESQRILNTNFNGAVSILNLAAQHFENRKSGWITGISSVAGDRGRASNYYYGSAKAGLTAYLSGLRNRLQASGVHVLTVKPGFVATKMTEGLPLPKPLTASAKQVAQASYKAQKKGKNVLYTIWPWFWIMFIIKHIPEGIFKKLKL